MMTHGTKMSEFCHCIFSTSQSVPHDGVCLYYSVKSLRRNLVIIIEAAATIIELK